MIVYGDKRIDEWVAGRLGFRPWSDSYSIANVKDGFILGACVFHNWFPEYGVIELTAASDRKVWLTRELINALGDYVFDHLKCQMLVMRTSEDNAEAQKTAKALGCSQYTIPRLRGKKTNEVLHCLTDDDWQDHRYRRRK